MSEWYDWCKANHVCYRCGKERADKGYTTCLACRMALNVNGLIPDLLKGKVRIIDEIEQEGLF